MTSVSIRISRAVVIVAVIVFMVAARTRAYDTDEYHYSVQMEKHPGWYDPAEWFDSDDSLDEQSDWFAATYGYADPYHYGTAGEGNKGYYKFNRRYGKKDFGLSYKYWTGDWYKNHREIEEW